MEVEKASLVITTTAVWSVLVLIVLNMEMREGSTVAVLVLVWLAVCGVILLANWAALRKRDKYE